MSQVTKEEGYAFERYADIGRFASYGYQLRELFATRPASVLEVGVGDGVVGNYLRAHAGFSYTSVDFASDLSPDVVGDVRKLPFLGSSFDTVCAFEVLEHLPFDDFEPSVRELARVARSYVLISLPHFGPPVKFSLKLPLLPEIRIAVKLPIPHAHRFNGQHYWELGKRGYPASRIRSVLARFGSIEREFIPFENQYHHFFVLRVAHADTPAI
jgi:hypothetical protein